MALITNRDQLEIIDKFVADLESSLGVSQKRVSFDSLWNDSPPIEANGQGLQEYMKDVSPYSISQESCSHLSRTGLQGLFLS